MSEDRVTTAQHLHPVQWILHVSFAFKNEHGQLVLLGTLGSGTPYSVVVPVIWDLLPENLREPSGWIGGQIAVEGDAETIQ